MLRAPRTGRDGRRRAVAVLAVAAAAALLAGCGTRDQTVSAQAASASSAAVSHEASLTEVTPSEPPTLPATLSESNRPGASASASGSASLPAPSTTGPAPAPAPSPQPSDGVLLTGEVTAPLRLTLDDLAALPQQSLDVTYQGATGQVSANESGPLLIDVLNRAGLRTDPATPNDIVNLAVIALGSSGRQAVLSLGEVSPEFAAMPPILSLAENGVALPGGPMVVVPSDVHNGRYVPGVVELRVVRV